MKFVRTKKFRSNTTVLLPVFKDGSHSAAIKKILGALGKDFEAKNGQLYYLHQGIHGIGDRVMLMGFGKKSKITMERVLENFGSAVKTAKAHRSELLGFSVTPEFTPHLQAIGESAVLANYNKAAPYKTGAAAKKIKSEEIRELQVDGIEKGSAEEKSIEKGFLIADACNDVRDWVNAGPNVANPEFFDEMAKLSAKKSGAKLTIFKNKELRKMNMGAILGVNRGSKDEARLIVIDYSPWFGADKKNPIVIVGKGIIFDSGGYNLKPRGHIEDMQLDKAGASAVIAIARLLKALNIRRRVILMAPMTENLIGSRAQKPSEIIHTYSGKTVEIGNTDAEGRLVLCDALAYAVDQYKPRYLIDIATLTGACMVALGYRYAGLFSNDTELAEKLRAAGEQTDELLWPLPLHKDHHEQVKSEYADLINSGTINVAGASHGAAFLAEFVGKTKWAHLDIAGPSFTKTPKKYEEKGATGFGVRALVRFLEQLSE